MANEFLENEKLREEIEILKLERLKLQGETLSNGLFGWIKTNVSTIAAVVALLVSVVGVFTSFWTMSLQVRQANDAARASLAESFRNALASATDSNVPIESRIASIWGMKTFWGTEHETTLANALAALLIADTDQRLRLTAADVIGEAYDSQNTPQSQKKARATLLYGTQSGVEGVVPRQLSFLSSGLSQKSNYEERRVAVVEAIRKNWEWLQDVNLRRADLRGGEFYDTNFKKANLQEVNFQYANLYGSDFTSALTEGIQLEHSNLYGVKGLCSGLIDKALVNKAVLMKIEDWRLWKAAGMLSPNDQDWKRWREGGFRVSDFGQPEDKAGSIIEAIPVLVDE